MEGEQRLKGLAYNNYDNLHTKLGKWKLGQSADKNYDKKVHNAYDFEHRTHLKMSTQHLWICASSKLG